MNGVEDHVHICCSLHPSIALADLVKDIKMGTTDLIRRKRLFPLFEGWQEGYSAFTYSLDSRKNVIQYVLDQEKHHQSKSFHDELLQELKMNGVEYDPKYLP